MLVHHPGSSAAGLAGLEAEAAGAALHLPAKLARAALPPSPATNGSVVVPRPFLCSSPTGLRRALSGFEAGPPPAAPEDCIARGDFFPGVFL
jgi:hypothetical protein